jgi:hypothetical protein
MQKPHRVISKSKQKAPSDKTIRTQLSNFALPSSKYLDGISCGSKYRKSASRISRTTWPKPPIAKETASTEISLTTALSKNAPRPPGWNETRLMGDSSSFHLPNRRAASSGDICFMWIANKFGLRIASFLAAKFPLQLPLPSRESLASWNEPGKSYTKRSAKPRPLSGSLASLKKRS